MQTLYDYRKYAILYVDDEEMSLKYFSRAFGEQFQILTATSARAGFELLKANADSVAILMTDQRMPGEKGVELLEKARQLRPRIIRILATAYSDLDAAIQAVNTGAIYKYVTKPWDFPQLESTLKRGLEFFIVQLERDQLLREKLTTLHNIMIKDRVISLGVLACGLGHHVRNALVAVRTFLDLAPAKLQEEVVDIEQLRNPHFWNNFYSQVQNQLMKITEMLTDLGAVGDQTPAGFPDEVRLHSVLPEIIAKIQSNLDRKQIILDSQISEALPPLMVDRSKFNRLFELLLEDELISLPMGSRISLQASEIKLGPNQEPAIRVEILDNGPGLRQEMLRSVFDPFFVRNNDPQQFGISLMACYFIVHHHGGRIEVESQSPQGTKFVLTLPTQPVVHLASQDEQDFLNKVLLNESLWEKLLAGV